MNLIDNYIFSKYKDSEFNSYGCYLKKLQNNDSNIYDKVNLYSVYVKIVNYQIGKYGKAINTAYERRIGKLLHSKCKYKYKRRIRFYE